jgi:hypothetical protein
MGVSRMAMDLNPVPVQNLVIDHNILSHLLPKFIPRKIDMYKPGALGSDLPVSSIMV